MLRGLRKASSNWVGKTIMFAVVGFLVISFAIWGIGDIFRGFGLSTVAKIGNSEITVEQFRLIYNERLQQYSRQLGRPITPDQAAALGLDQQIIGQLIAETALDERARRLGLGLSDQQIAQSIRNDRNFWGVNGQFDRPRFEAALRQAGYSEARYLAEQRRGQLRQQLVGAIAAGTPVSRAEAEALSRYRNETRAVDYVILDNADAGTIPTPTPEAIASYFEERKALFRAPEYRKLTILSVIPADQARWINIPEAEAKQAYEQRRARYVTPEQRHVFQIVFPTAADAQAAAEKIAGGATLASLAAERGIKDSDIDLGMIPKTAIGDRVVADAAFALKAGETSAPVAGRFGTSLLQVTEIEPEKTRAYEEMSGEIKRDLAIERAKAALASAYDQIEDARAGGSSIAEAAEKLNLTARTVDAIDRSGRDADGEPIKDLTGIPDLQAFLGSAFGAEVGVENDPIQAEGGYVWYDVLAVTPGRERTLDEVKDQVTARWREDEITSRLRAKATQMVEKVSAGSPLAEVAQAERKKVEQFTDLKRNQPTGPFAANTLDRIFRTAKGKAATSDGNEPTEQFVFVVTAVDVPAFDPASDLAKQVEQALRTSRADAVLNEYVARIEKDIGSSINQAALRQAVGGTTGQNFN